MKVSISSRWYRYYGCSDWYAPNFHCGWDWWGDGFSVSAIFPIQPYSVISVSANKPVCFVQLIMLTPRWTHEPKEITRSTNNIIDNDECNGSVYLAVTTCLCVFCNPWLQYFDKVNIKNLTFCLPVTDSQHACINRNKRHNLRPLLNNYKQV